MRSLTSTIQCKRRPDEKVAKDSTQCNFGGRCGENNQRPAKRHGERTGRVDRVSGGAARIDTLLVKTLTPFGTERFDFTSSATFAQIDSDTAPGLALLVHELATNAVKYGALSVDEGRVAIVLEIHGLTAKLSWVEQGGPGTGTVSQSGFGTRLLKAALANCGGSASRRFEPTGVVCEMSSPLVAANERAIPAAKTFVQAKNDGRIASLR